MPKAGIHGTRCSNCILASGTKFAKNGTVSTNETKEISSANCLAVLVSFTKTSANAPRTGISKSINRLSMYPLTSSILTVKNTVYQQHHNRDNHHKDIRSNIATLQQANSPTRLAGALAQCIDNAINA